MANPTPYTKAFNFAGYQAMNPVLPAPGSRLDTEFSNVATSIASLRSSVMNVRREDGKLVNGIVTMDALSAEVKAALDTDPADLTAVEEYVDEQVAASTATLEAYVDTQTLVNQATYVRTAAQWLEATGVMAGPAPSDLAIAIAEGAATGRRIMIPDEDYAIASQITITDMLTKPLRLEFHRNSRVNLSADLIGANGCFLAVSNAGRQCIEIEGGNFNADAQPKPGSGQSWAVLSLSNVSGGGIYRSRFKAGDDWLDDKSDSAVFVYGDGFTISRSYFQGFSDAAIYTSGDGSGANSYGLNAVDNEFFQCSAAFLSKRRGIGSIFANNLVRKCANGAATGEAASGATLYAGGNKLIISDNQFDECIVPVYLENADYSVVSGNSIRGWGLNLDGSVSGNTKGAIRLLGTQHSKVYGNTAVFLGTSTAANGIMMQAKTLSGVTTQCLYNTISDNDLDGGTGAGIAQYEANSSDHNHWVGNRLNGTWATDYNNTGAHSVCDYWDAAGNRHVIFDSTERLLLNADGMKVTPANSTGRFTVERHGVPSARIEIFCDGGGDHFRSLSDKTAAKETLYESRTFDNGAVSGGSLGHRFDVGAVVRAFVVGETSIKAALALIPNYADDAAAAAGGLAVGDFYRTGSALKIRAA